MAQFNLQIMQQYKESIAFEYAKQLQAFRRGDNHYLQKYGEFLEAALPFFPPAQQARYRLILETGRQEEAFQNASGIYRNLKENQQARGQAIDDFLTTEDSLQE